MKLLLYFAVISQVAMSQAFQPSLIKTIALRTTLQTKVLNSAFYELDPVSKMNLNRAHDCANNYGKCSIKELEEMKKALKTERLQHEALGLPLDPVEELDHRLLEEDLNLQLSLLKDEMMTVPPLFHDLRKDNEAPSHDNAVAAIANPNYYHHDHTLRDYIEQGEELFLMPNGLSEAFSFGMALFIIALSSYLLQQS
mmetsp:Transcript_5545/g.10555  ORF Transcript_5545/g.10555 Transcript_5545/m.10555 type:complete len:197 (+) Transcript_5545:277-867(+)|eukprot:CAMPEP_0176497292 /NCGR_PEP_ID=MMETSP0200_2-20121128/11644_1 /TAXON_ID=947934 /ORGANISM="Chaetoceros sp., Strain GSL56" /LENGTH=196 /DNA_ID=CAMNT_0017895291 /DNA_START=125 /DNA_END=715 /DNA_ORIENTATION=-